MRKTFRFASLLGSLLAVSCTTPYSPDHARVTTKSIPDFFVPVMRHHVALIEVDGKRSERDFWGTYQVRGGSQHWKVGSANGQWLPRARFDVTLEPGTEYLLTGYHRREGFFFQVKEKESGKILIEERENCGETSNLPLIITIPTPAG